MDSKKTFSLREIPKFIGKVLGRIYRGNLLLSLDAGKYFVHILYIFFLFGAAIFLSLKIDASLRRVEENTRTIASQETVITIRKYEIEVAESKKEINRKLKEKGSNLQAPSKPATQIK